MLVLSKCPKATKFWDNNFSLYNLDRKLKNLLSKISFIKVKLLIKEYSKFSQLDHLDPINKLIKLKYFVLHD